MKFEIIQQTRSFAKEHMNSYDSSHDYEHVLRVVRNSKTIFRNELESGTVENIILMVDKIELIYLIEMAALLHDVNDHKYNKPIDLGAFLKDQGINEKDAEFILNELKNGDIQKINNMVNENQFKYLVEMSDSLNGSKQIGKVTKLNQFLKKQGMSENQINMILYVVENVSFSKERKNGTPNFIKSEPFDSPKNTIARFILNIVRDADRLDAIGSIGIARTFIFSSKTGNPIYEPLKELKDNKKSTVGHFYEKLLLLKDGMKNQHAKKMAHERHEIMKLFLKHLNQEIKI